jgi:glycine/D-amino acid oxidase-like deaminating enzyme
VSLATALGLVQAGVEVTVVDRDREIGATSRAAGYRAQPDI